MTEDVGLEIKACFREWLGSTLGRNTGIVTEDLHRFRQSLQTYAEIAPR
jgi:hypothetical protein